METDLRFPVAKDESSAPSLSEVFLRASIPGKKGEISIRILKHLAPVTFQKLELSIPFSGRINFFEKNFVYLMTPIIGGEEKSKLEFDRSAVAFLPAGSMICFFLQKTKSAKPMNLIGNVVTGLDLLENARRGDSLVIEKSIPSTAGG